MRPRVGLEVCMRSAVLASLTVLVTLASPLSSQPVFRTGTTLVEVSAIVTRDGRPVTDLRADEVMVLDNGQPQPLVAFEYVDLTQVEEAAQRRDFVLVLDDLHVGPARTMPAIGAALAFVDALGPHDRLSVANTGPFRLSLDLTTEREAARRLIRKFRGQAGNAGPFEIEARTSTAMQVLIDVAAAVRSDAAERRAVLLISEGHGGFSQERHAGLSPAGQAVFQDYMGVLREAAASNVAIYTVDPRGLTAPATAHVPSRELVAARPGEEMQALAHRDIFGSLALLARNTGGVQTLWSNDLTKVFPRMLEDSRKYYRLAYAPVP
jgi:VWFA-related protein